MKTNSKIDAEKQLSLKGRAISECMLSTSACTVASVIVGTFLGKIINIYIIV